jgi:hypothetical protein
MGARILGVLAVLALLAGPVQAETLADLLTARGVTAPAGLPQLDEPVRGYQVLDDERDLLVVYVVGTGESAQLHAVGRERAAGRWRAARLDWTVTPDGAGLRALEVEWCRSGLAVDRFPGGFLVRAHISPSAECTIVLGPDLAVLGVLAGWPVATLADGRLVYQRNQIHFASFHPVALALFDARRPVEVSLYPPRPAQEIRRAHVARMRGVYTPAWCNAHNHPCDPELFDEHVSGRVVADAGGDALAFVMAWDNTTGWSDRERWGRLEAFRELRAALAHWDGQGDPPADLYRALAAGLARVRNMKGEGHVAAALAEEPALRDLVGAALAAPRAAGQDDRDWLRALDRRWSEGATWRRLGRAARVPREFTEVVYVYSGLRRPETMRYREMRRADFEARFGPGAPGRALEPGVLREIFRAGVN